MKGEPFPAHPVLIVDDEPAVVEGLSITLKSHGIDNIIGCGDSRQVMGYIRDSDVEVVLLDLAMPHISGKELLERIHEDFPHIPVVVVTAANELETAVECMKIGAFDYMVKVVEDNRLVSGIRRAIEIRELKREYDELRSRFLTGELRHPEAFSGIITQNRKMKSIFLYLESVAQSKEPVLILGETGVGKDLLAGAIHEASGRSGAFVTVNAAGLDDGMFADTLFGHMKGAYTGALEARGGLIEQARGGTLFLDEIGDLSVQSQVKLLRLLDAREYYPLGSDLAKRTDARLVLATNRDIDMLVGENRFRKDLYYRLSTHEVRVPPLRERKEDLPLLLDFFMEQAAESLAKGKPFIPAELVTLLGTYHFPGNIRELRGMTIDAVTKHSSRVMSLMPFREAIDRSTGKSDVKPEDSLVLFTEKLPTNKQIVELLVDEAMRRAQGNQSIAAGLLGITHQALNKRLQRRRKD
jgi:DNA-binding NtrC family response regulator